jgi:hypothetical protein
MPFSSEKRSETGSRSARRMAAGAALSGDEVFSLFLNPIGGKAVLAHETALSRGDKLLSSR